MKHYTVIIMTSYNRLHSSFQSKVTNYKTNY